MKIRPLRIEGQRERPLRDSSPLEVIAYLRGGDAVESTYLQLAWAGELGACSRGRRAGESVEAYAAVVVAEYESQGVGPLDLIRAVDVCWSDAIAGSGLVPSPEDFDRLGKPSTGTEPSSTG